ncbi:MAG: flagellar basal body rod protein FlgB [Phycisphaerae bacterium]
MFISNITERGVMPALVKSLAFNEARLGVIAENIANSETPGYKTKHLDAAVFQRALRKALDARGNDTSKPLVISAGTELRTDAHGFLQATPTEDGNENILFHDGTNMSLERQMADLAETGMAHELVTALLDMRFDELRRAIRGRA